MLFVVVDAFVVLFVSQLAVHHYLKERPGGLRGLRGVVASE